MQLLMLVVKLSNKLFNESKFKNFFKKYFYGLNELKQRIIFLIIALLFFRVGSFISIPGINVGVITNLLKNQQNTFLDMLNIFSGGSLNHASIFALGVMPYISASIIMQLLIILLPVLKKKKKDGELDNYIISNYVRYITFFLSLFQSFLIAISLPNMYIIRFFIFNPGIFFYITTILSLVCGSMFLMWLSEQITEFGIGNGISIIIFIGIISNLPSVLINILDQFLCGNINILHFILSCFFIFLIIFLVTYFECAQRRIFVSYIGCKQVCSFYIHQNTYLPFKINMSGVVPSIFTSTIIIFLSFFFSWLSNIICFKYFTIVSMYLKSSCFLYLFLFILGVLFFCFFYTSLILSPNEISINLKNSGVFITGIRPGKQTTEYINKIVTNLTFIGVFYIILICLISEYIRKFLDLPFYFNGTSILIIVVVIIEFINQIKNLILSFKYNFLFKKYKF
ncbi:MAG: preprotein translocase subunit SecY [gamma proteobacterium endosymbiont of Trioza apicalis]